MSLRETLDTSIAVYFFQDFYKKWHSNIGQKIEEVYCSSQIYKSLKRFWEKIKIYFRYSFLGKITEIKQVNPATLNNSRSVQCLLNCCKKWKVRIIKYLETSLTITWTKDIENDLYFSPIRIISSILVVLILTNAVLSVALNKRLELWGFLIRVLFLFTATIGLSCKTNWTIIKKDSLFLRTMCFDSSKEIDK